MASYPNKQYRSPRQAWDPSRTRRNIRPPRPANDNQPRVRPPRPANDNDPVKQLRRDLRRAAPALIRYAKLLPLPMRAGLVAIDLLSPVVPPVSRPGIADKIDFSAFDPYPNTRFVVRHGPNDPAVYYPAYAPEISAGTDLAYFDAGTGPGTGLIDMQSVGAGIYPPSINATRYGLWAKHGFLDRYAQVFAFERFDANEHGPRVGTATEDVVAQLGSFARPGMSIVPDPFKSPLVNPWPSAQPHVHPPGAVVAHGRKPVPYSLAQAAAGLGLGPMFHVGGQPAVAPSVFPSPAYSGRKPPGENTKERKTRAMRAFQIIGGAFGTATEFMDFMDALYDALPKEYRIVSYYKGKKIKPSWDKRWASVYLHFDKIDLDQAVKNVAANHIEDFVIGKMNSAANKIPGTPKGVNRHWWNKLNKPKPGDIPSDDDDEYEESDLRPGWFR